MPRLFTALAVPTDIAAALAAYQGGLPGARWIAPGDFHVTLRFLGDVERTMAEDFLDLLGERRSRAPLAVTLDGLGVFGGGKPRAILATVHPSPEIVDLQDEQERLARRAGLAPETRRFTPPCHPRPPAPGGGSGGGGDVPVAGPDLHAPDLHRRPG